MKNEFKFPQPEIFTKIKWSIKTKKFLLAIRRFPNLALLWNKNWASFSEKGIPMSMKWINLLFKNETGGNWLSSKDSENNTEFMELINGIITYEKFQQLKNFHHHESSIYDHSF